MSAPWVGIDPGREGAIVRLGGDGDASWLLPFDEAGLSGRQLARILRDEVCSRTARVVLERAQSMPKQGIASAFRYGRDYGVIMGALDALGIPYQTVPPGVWHRRIVGGEGDPKARARAVVEARLPELELRPGRRKKAHEGIVDAACLALYGQWTVWGGE